MGILYKVRPVNEHTRGWFSQPLSPTSLPTDADIRQVVGEMPGLTADLSVHDGAIAQVRLERGQEHTVLNAFVSEEGERRMYFEKGSFSLVYDFAAQLARFCGPLVVIPDSDSIPLLVPPADANDEELARQGYVTTPSLSGAPPRFLFFRRKRPRPRRMLVGKLPRVEPELVQKLGLVRQEHSFLALNADGDVIRVFLVRTRDAKSPPPEIVQKLGVVREPGFLYLIDSAGDLVRYRQIED